MLNLKIDPRTTLTVLKWMAGFALICLLFYVADHPEAVWEGVLDALK